MPIAINNSLPEYVVRSEGYVQRMRVQWQEGDHFRMFFGGKISSKTHKKIKTGGWVGGGCMDGWVQAGAYLWSCVSV